MQDLLPSQTSRWNVLRGILPVGEEEAPYHHLLPPLYECQALFIQVMLRSWILDCSSEVSYGVARMLSLFIQVMIRGWILDCTSEVSYEVARM